MKVIGLCGGNTYLVEITKQELEKSLNKYYGNLGFEPKVGQIIDIGAGYDYRSDINSAAQAMVDASKKFDAVQKTMLAFAAMVSQLPIETDSH